MCERHYAAWRSRSGLPLMIMDEDNEYGERYCPDCEQWLPDFEFYRYGSACKTCRPKAPSRARVALDKLRADLVAAQDSLCAICSQDIAGVMSNGRALANVDHDHSCCPGLVREGCGDCVRGALCPQCNSGLGNFYDSVDNLLAAVTYLNDWKVRKQEVERAA